MPYQVVGIQTRSIMSSGHESAQDAFNWCQEHLWIPARFEGDPNAQVMVQQVELVTSPAEVKPGQVSQNAREIQHSILERIPVAQRSEPEVQAEALAIAQLWEYDPPQARRAEHDFVQRVGRCRV